LALTLWKLPKIPRLKMLKSLQLFGVDRADNVLPSGVHGGFVRVIGQAPIP